MTKINILIQIVHFLAITGIIVGYTERVWAEPGHVKWGKTTTTTTTTTTTHSQHEHKTILQFYFHDNITGDALTAVKIAEPEDASPGVTGFGKLFMADEPLTMDPDPDSKLVGRAQGMWGRSSMTDRTLFMSFTYVFFQGIYNGSSVTILGRNLITQPIREMPVVGGTGLFRMARGYALAQTYFINITSFNAVVGYNLTIFH